MPGKETKKTAPATEKKVAEKKAAPAKKPAAKTAQPAAKKAKAASGKAVTTKKAPTPAKPQQQPAKKATKAVAKKGAAKKAPAKDAKKPVEKKEKKPRVNQQQRLRMLIQRPAKSFRIGQDLLPHRARNLTRFVRWPKYIRMQRQKRILLKRLKMPPPLNQFNMTLDKGTAVNLFKLLHKYRPDEKTALRKRRLEAARKIALARKADAESKKHTKVREALAELNSKKPLTVKCGLNHVTNLVERAKAQLVVIAHDVDPIELVVWLPALCRKKKIPYCIVKGKARLGALVHQKTASCVALTNVRKDDRTSLDQIIEVVKSQFNDNPLVLRNWSDQKFGIKHRQAEAKHLRRVQKAEAIKEKLAAAPKKK